MAAPLPGLWLAQWRVSTTNQDCFCAHKRGLCQSQSTFYQNFGPCLIALASAPSLTRWPCPWPPPPTAVAIVAALALFLVARKRQKAGSQGELETRLTTLPSGSSGKMDGSDSWAIPYEDLEISRRLDGSEWLLGEGRFGKVLKGVKGGVQVGGLFFGMRGCQFSDIP